MSENVYKRVLFKISGESLMGSKPFGHDLETINYIAKQIIKIANQGVEICIVIGGGNIFRGISVSAEEMDRVSADYMGMLATNINGLALQSILEKQGAVTRMQSAIRMDTVCEGYVRRRALRHLEKKRIVIFVSGTGNPFFTTDTAAVLRAIEMNCDVILKGTQVDGVYSADPKIDKDAIRYDKLTYDEVIAKNLKVMDATAFTLARDNKIPILVFSINAEDALFNAVNHQGKFTIVS